MPDVLRQLRAACFACPPSLHEIQPIVDGHPDSVKVRDKFGALPLHITCLNKAPLDVVQFLVSKYPFSVRVKDKHGRLLLHIACSSEAQLDVVHFLVNQYPESVKVPDTCNGALPLHVAFRYAAPFEVIQLLVETYPDSINVKDNYSVTPVDLARKKMGRVAHEVVAWLESFATSACNASSNAATVQPTIVSNSEAIISNPDCFNIVSDANSEPMNLSKLRSAIEAEDKQVAALFESFHRQPSNQPAFWLKEEHQDVIRIIIAEKCKTKEEEAEREAILASPGYGEFYLLLVRKLYCMISACESLSSGLLGSIQTRETLRTYTLRLLADNGSGLETIKKTRIGAIVAHAIGFTASNSALPFADAIGSFFKLIVQLKWQRDQYLGISNVADFATRATMQQDSNGLRYEVERFARLIVRARCQTKIGKQTKMHFLEQSGEFGRIKKFMCKLFADPGDTPAKEQGSWAADCALAHIMKPGNHCYLNSILSGENVNFALHEALAASTLYMSIKELQMLPKFSTLHNEPTKDLIFPSKYFNEDSRKLDLVSTQNPLSCKINHSNSVLSKQSSNSESQELFSVSSEVHTKEDSAKSAHSRRTDDTSCMDSPTSSIIQSWSGETSSPSATKSDFEILEQKMKESVATQARLDRTVNDLTQKVTKLSSNHNAGGLMYADHREQYKDEVKNNTDEIRQLMEQVSLLKEAASMQQCQSEMLQSRLMDMELVILRSNLNQAGPAHKQQKRQRFFWKSHTASN